MSFDTLPDGGYKCVVKKQRPQDIHAVYRQPLPYKFASIFAKYQKINGKNRTADLFFVFLQHTSRCSKLVYTIHVGISQFNIALSHSFAPTTIFHQSRSPLRSFFKTAVGTK